MQHKGTEEYPRLVHPDLPATQRREGDSQGRLRPAPEGG
jgi:hypothetical protein